MDYYCAKFVVSAVLVLPCGQTHRQTHTKTDADERFTPATVVGVNNKQERLQSCNLVQQFHY